MTNATPSAIAVLIVELIPAAAFGFAGDAVVRMIAKWPAVIRLLVPAVFSAPYLILSLTQHVFRWEWFAIYALLPVVMAWLLTQAAEADPEQRGNWRDALI